MQGCFLSTKCFDKFWSSVWIGFILPNFRHSGSQVFGLAQAPRLFLSSEEKCVLPEDANSAYLSLFCMRAQITPRVPISPHQLRSGQVSADMKSDTWTESVVPCCWDKLQWFPWIRTATGKAVVIPWHWWVVFCDMWLRHRNETE